MQSNRNQLLIIFVVYAYRTYYITNNKNTNLLTEKNTLINNKRLNKLKTTQKKSPQFSPFDLTVFTFVKLPFATIIGNGFDLFLLFFSFCCGRWWWYDFAIDLYGTSRTNNWHKQLFMFNIMSLKASDHQAMIDSL